jgi:signal transduction histidine kinase
MTALRSSNADSAVKSSPETIRSRWYWRNWPVVVKLAAVLLVPTIVALVAGILRIVDQAGAAPGYVRITQIVRVQQQLSDLIGAMGRERDLATTFVATGRLGDRRGLDAQFRAVDDSARVVAGAAGQVEGLGFSRAPLAELGAMATLRASVTTGFGPVEVVVTEYSDAIDPLVELDAALTRQLDDVAITNDAAAVHDLLAGREQVGRQHAIVLAALYFNRLGPGQIEDLRTATVRLATEQDAVRAALAPAERTAALAGVGPEAELSRQRVLQLVLNRGVAGLPLNTSPEDWDRRNAVVVENIAAVEKNLRQRIEQTAQSLLDHVRTAAGLNSVILFFALGLGVLVGILVTRALLRPLGVLKRTALDVADRRLPEAMARIREGEAPEAAIEPVPVGTREEIGQVARAFDEVHSQAVRLAGEQAQLRANVNDIFVNLSRRTQGLVERQLKLIDRLESGEQDPKQLDNLFQLDHLATRMRRNSENLLVLAGTDATNRSGRPVRLIDVLRAAVSEVEQYQRLVLQQPPTVLVLGRSASDLVHLLAELLDNATQFSPPDSHVMVSSDLGRDGAVAIEVADRGVGMTDAELAEANQRLASPAAVDASVSRRMGLFVVGRLAGRHGIAVQLRRGDAGVGIWATVVMPSQLVRVAVEPDEPPATVISEGAATNGSVPGGTAGLLASRNGVPAPRQQAELRADAADGHDRGGDETELTGAQAGGDEAHDGQPDGQEIDAEQADVEQADAGQVDADDGPSEGQPIATGVLGRSGLPQRNGSRTTPPVLPPAPPGPPATPPVENPEQIPGGGSSADLFRPARPSVTETAGPGQRVTLQHSTPIFDDVASAWFKEHEGVPVGWTAPAGRVPAGATREAPARQAPSPNAPLPDAPSAEGAQADATATGAPRTSVAGSATIGSVASVTVGSAASATVGSPLIRRQPGRTLAEGDPSKAGKLRPSAPPAPASGVAPSAGSADWGAGDAGWRAAEALAMPVSAETTAIGLPRRQPRALLVPGAAGGTGSASAPVRSAESIRGRLASYQRGIREGRQARANGDHNAGGSQPEQQSGEEETT